MFLGKTTQSILSGVSEFFGLDLGTTAIRVVQLRGSGPIKALDRYGQMALPGTLALSESKADRQKVAQAIKGLLRQVGISTENVAANLPSNRVFTTIIDIDKLPGEELARTIRYQADSFIPTPLAQSKIDWAVLGDSPKDPKKAEILLSSIDNKFLEDRLDMLESVGLNVIAFEPDNMALARALIPVDITTPEMVLDIGSAATDLIIAVAGVPRLSRSIPTGTTVLVRAVVQSLSIEVQQAEQFVFKFGLGKDKLEGQIYNSIIGVVDNLVAEIEKSIKFFQGRYPSQKLERIIVTGGASALPEFPLYLANHFGINVEIGNAWGNVSFPASRQNELLAVSNHFGVATGLAEREA
jgi:type IV pilus assembly protein PilM